MKSEEILRVATRMRSALESSDKAKMPIMLQDFPAGSCGDAALLLAAYLGELGFGEFQYVLASRGDARINTWHSHAWLEGCGLIVDITADQFPNFQERVFVGESSEFHSTFEVEERYVADFRRYDSHTVKEYRRAYAEAMKLIARA